MGPAERKLRAMFEKYGYGIIARLDPAPVGYIIPGVNIGEGEFREWHNPFVVISETTKDEWDVQCRLSGDPDVSLHPAYKYFYRVSTD